MRETQREREKGKERNAQQARRLTYYSKDFGGGEGLFWLAIFMREREREREYVDKND